MAAVFNLAGSKRIPIVILTSNAAIGKKHSRLVTDIFKTLAWPTPDVVYSGYQLGKGIPSKMEYILSRFFQDIDT